MAENSSIEWTDHTFNPVRGCTKISPGCANCYAAREAVRFPGIRGIWGDAGTRIVAVPTAWKAPVQWNAKAAREGIRRKVFCASLADVFEDWKGDLRFPADKTPEGWLPAWWDGKELVREFEASAESQGLKKATMNNLRTELFRLIEHTPWLDWQLLTKRPENVMRMVPRHWRKAFPDNVWMGTTVENQAMADQRIPQLLNIPVKTRFLSCEPLLGPVDLPKTRYNNMPLGMMLGDKSVLSLAISWVICGGESGPAARPMHPDWARSLRDQCAAAGVPFFFKQWGEYREVDAPLSKPGDPAVLVKTASHAFDVLQFVKNPSWVDLEGTHYKALEDLPEEIACRLLDRVSKHAAGRLLDNQLHNAFPS